MPKIPETGIKMAALTLYLKLIKKYNYEDCNRLPVDRNVLSDGERSLRGVVFHNISQYTQ